MLHVAMAQSSSHKSVMCYASELQVLSITSRLVTPHRGKCTCLSQVGWLEFNVPFQHKYSYIRDTLNLTLAAFLLSSHPKRERNQEAHLNYYASTYNKGRQLSHRKSKLNRIQQNTRINLN